MDGPNDIADAARDDTLEALSGAAEHAGLWFKDREKRYAGGIATD